MKDNAGNTNDKDKSEDPTSRTEQTRSRRRKLLAGGGTVLGAAAFPKEWVKPVFESVDLPAHAQTSGSTLGAQLLVFSDASDWLDFLAPRAVAAPPVAFLVGGCLILEFLGTVVTATINPPPGPYSVMSKSGSYDPVSGAFSVSNIGGIFDVSGTASGGATPTVAHGRVTGGGTISFTATPGGATCVPLTTSTTTTSTTTAAPTTSTTTAAPTTSTTTTTTIVPG